MVIKVKTRGGADEGSTDEKVGGVAARAGLDGGRTQRKVRHLLSVGAHAHGERDARRARGGGQERPRRRSERHRADQKPRRKTSTTATRASLSLSVSLSCLSLRVEIRASFALSARRATSRLEPTIVRGRGNARSTLPVGAPDPARGGVRPLQHQHCSRKVRVRLGAARHSSRRTSTGAPPIPPRAPRPPRRRTRRSGRGRREANATRRSPS
jgi:hypothetical protein